MKTKVITKADWKDLTQGYAKLMDHENGSRAWLTMTGEYDDEVAYKVGVFDLYGRKIEEKFFDYLEAADAFLQELIKKGFRKLF
jgi:hypothetical protein